MAIKVNREKDMFSRGKKTFLTPIWKQNKILAVFFNITGDSIRAGFMYKCLEEIHPGYRMVRLASWRVGYTLSSTVLLYLVK